MTGSLRLNPRGTTAGGRVCRASNVRGEEMRRMLCAFSFQFSARKYSTEKHFSAEPRKQCFRTPETVFQVPYKSLISKESDLRPSL